MARTPRPAARAWQPDAALLDGLTIAAFALDDQGVVAYANAAALTLFGTSYDELLGADARVRLVDEAARGVVDDVVATVRERGAWTGDLDLLVGGVTTSLPTTWSAVTGEAGREGALVLVEKREQSGAPAGRRLRRLASVTQQLLVAGSLDEVADLVTQQIKDAAGATVVSLALLVDDDTLVLMGLSGASDGVRSDYASFALGSDNPAADSARLGEPLYLAHDEIAARYPAMPAVSHGVRSMLCLPLAVGARTLGVMSLSLPGRHGLDEAERVYLALLADMCAMTVDRIQAQAAAEDRESKLTFLADVSAQLLGDLDYEKTLASVAQAAVPWFADWCTVALNEDSRLRTITVAHGSPDHEALVRELQERYGPEPGDGAYGVLESGRSLLVPEVTDALLRTGARDDDHYAMLSRLGLRSVLSCALAIGERSFGVISWVTGEGGRRFTPADQAFGEDLARRAAVAIDNAQLHTQVRDGAWELQRAVLPEVLPGVAGWTTVVEYLPAGRSAAGGDFYDVIPLEDGRVAMFVGDVMGRGVAATSVMAQMRSAIRTLVAVDPSPSVVMAGMDRVFDALHLEQLVTMVYAIADPALDHLQVINAGHPPPVLLAHDGQVEVLEHPSTLILGVGGGRRAVRSAEFRAGDSLLLYTDGLVERRGEDADTSMSRLIAALRSPMEETPDAWLHGVVEELRDPTRDDDVAAMWIARDPLPT